MSLFSILARFGALLSKEVGMAVWCLYNENLLDHPILHNTARQTLSQAFCPQVRNRARMQK